jgi:cystathionine beta-lyase
MKRDTQITHLGRTSPFFSGSVNPPVYRASTVTFPTMAAMADAQGDYLNAFYYGRIGTPTTMAFEEAVAAAEGGERTIAVPSGLAAIVGTLTALVKSGDHILVSDSVYGPTRTFCQDVLAKNGVAVEYFHPLCGDTIRSLFKAQHQTGVLRNPRVADLRDAGHPGDRRSGARPRRAGGGRQHLASPIFFRPFEKGVDVSIQARPRYIVGHSDAMLGTITTREELFGRIKSSVVKYGYSVGSEEAYLGFAAAHPAGADEAAPGERADRGALAATPRGSRQGAPSRPARHARAPPVQRDFLDRAACSA